MGKHNSLFRPRVEHVNFQDLLKYGEHMPSGCIEWTQRRNSQGYGSFKLQSHANRVHRYVTRLFYGDPADESMYAMHLCDNPPCFNPDHLRWGTPLENTRDMDAKGRSKRPNWQGEKMFTAKLRAAQVIEIRELYAYGFSLRELARIYGVDHTNISAIIRRKSWKHI